ncbi:calcium-binding protein [Desulfovibrio sp. OttesenSCG-928-C14]|nr:calcium-binding protein [Desulfovibrio sp. OttesenSCG-928-C14]
MVTLSTMLKATRLTQAIMPGQGWSPKPTRNMVGRDILANTATSFEEGGPRKIVLADKENSISVAGVKFNFAKSQTQKGLSVDSFADVDVKSKKNFETLYESDTRAIAYHAGSGKNGSVSVYEKIEKKDENGKVTGIEYKEMARVDLSQDARISLDADDNPLIFTGSKALSNGVLKAKNENEILLRVSSADVEAGKGSTVLNLSNSKGGKFSGGHAVTYLGRYEESEITGGSGESKFAGYFNGAQINGAAGRSVFSGVFEGSTLDAGGDKDVFSGYFGGSTVNGGAGNDEFSGMFMYDCLVNGDDGDDRFNGRFISSKVNGGDGDDIFGGYINLTKQMMDGKYLGQRTNEKGEFVADIIDDEASKIYGDFIDSQIDAGNGNNRVSAVGVDSTFTLGDGNDRVSGIFTGTTVNGGDGDDNITAMYAVNSIFDTGAGNNHLALATASANMLRTGEGRNSVVLGYNRGASGVSAANAFGGDSLLTRSAFLTDSEFKANDSGKEFGELHSNFVDAALGDNDVLINNGESTQHLRAANIYAEEEQGEEGAAARGAAASGATRALEEGGKDSSESLSKVLEDTLDSASAGLNEAEQTRRRKVLDRYAMVSGQGPAQRGALAAVVSTGAGQAQSFFGMQRFDFGFVGQEEKSEFFDFMRAGTPGSLATSLSKL